MEPAKIDWKSVESIFVEDKLYETINAPKWVDFLNPEDDTIDDESWFCRPDCKHPKIAEDFFRTTPPAKFMGSADKSKTPLGNWNRRDAKLKRVPSGDRSSRFSEDCENQNPNLSTTYQANFMKAMLKSSGEKKKPMDEISQKNETVSKLKSTLSARNLFAGKDIVSHISEFCNELKKLAMRAREGEGDEKEKKNVAAVELNEKERKPLLEVGREKCEGTNKGGVKDKQRKIKINEDAGNICVTINSENVKQIGEERLLQIRTNPPPPQCFSATKLAPPKPSKSRLMERGVLQELTQNKEGRERWQRSYVFGFLKPCTLSS